MTNNEIKIEAVYKVGDRVVWRGKRCTVARVAKPIRFDVGSYPDRHIEVMPAFDLVAGDDVDSFEADFYPRVQQDEIRVC